MNESYKRILRTFQTFLPPAREFKFAVQSSIRRVFRYPHERDFEALRLLEMTATDQIVDIGANRGQSIQSIRLFRPDAEIVAFEPNKTLFAALVAKYGKDPRLRLVNAAVGARARKATLHIPVYRGFAFDGLATLDREIAETALQGALIGFRNRHLRIEKHPCEVVTLDEMDLTPDFIKIDTEGTTLDVLRGARETLTRHFPAIMAELAHPGGPVEALLAGWHYRIMRYEKGRLIPDLGGDLNSIFLARATHLAAAGPDR